MVRFAFRTRKLRDLFVEEKGAHKHPAGVVDAFFEVMSVIKHAADENDLRSLKSLHCEKLKGQRGKRRELSVRLTGQWRLVFTIETDEEGRFLNLSEIVDYH